MISGRYKAVAAVAVTLWLGTMAFLYWSNGAGQSRSPDIAASTGALAPGEEYMGAYIGDERVGWIRTRTESADGGYLIFQSGEIWFRVQGQSKRIAMEGLAATDLNFKLRSFKMGMDADSMKLEAKGSVSKGVIPVELTINGENKTMEIPYSDDTVLDLTADRYIAKKGMKAGDRHELKVIDPQSLSPVKITVEVVGVEPIRVQGGEVPATHVRRIVGGAVFDAWLDADGKALKETGPLGITFVREDPAEGLKKGVRIGRDLVESASITVNREILNPEKLKSLSLKLVGAPFQNLAIAGGRQTFTDGVVTVQIETIDSSPGIILPVKDPQFFEHLKPTVFIESDSAEIAMAAKKASGGETDALKAALKINDWLFANLAKKNVVGVPDALTTLRSLEGDCNEHTYLFVAMARSIGIPARANAGIAYLGGKFYYHAWPEVWTGSWVTMDPTWGQAPADVTHIRFVQGEASKLTDILGLFGKLKLEVVSWQ